MCNDLCGVSLSQAMAYKTPDHKVTWNQVETFTFVNHTACDCRPVNQPPRCVLAHAHSFTEPFGHQNVSLWFFDIAENLFERNFQIYLYNCYEALKLINKQPHRLKIRKTRVCVWSKVKVSLKVMWSPVAEMMWKLGPRVRLCGESGV